MASIFESSSRSVLLFYLNHHHHHLTLKIVKTNQVKVGARRSKVQAP